MSVKTSIPVGLLAAFDVNERGLQSFVKSQRAAYYRMSDRWKATDRAAVISDWLDRLEEVAELLAKCKDTVA